MLLRADDPEEYLQWLRIWDKLPGHEPFAHPAYSAAYANENCMPACFYYMDAGGTMLFPFLVRALKGERWVPRDLECTDLVTPYGYGGPFMWNGPNQNDSWTIFYSEVKRLKAVCLFARLSLFEKSIATLPGETSIKSWNIVRECDSSPENIWMDYEHKVRKNVKSAIRNGVCVEVDPSGVRLDDFLRVFYSTMDRRTAKPEYRSERQFLQNLITRMPDQVCFFHAKKEGQVISTELVLISDEYVYSFLGGTQLSSFHLRPNDILKHEIILWCRERGRRAYVLGGGYAGEDGIFRYKKSFAPNGLVPFRVGQMIFESERYSKLVQMRRAAESALNKTWEPDPHYFPTYRG